MINVFRVLKTLRSKGLSSSGEPAAVKRALLRWRLKVLVSRASRRVYANLLRRFAVICYIIQK